MRRRLCQRRLCDQRGSCISHYILKADLTGFFCVTVRGTIFFTTRGRGHTEVQLSPKEICSPTVHSYVYAAFPIFLTVANATFLLRKRKNSDGNLLVLSLIFADWEKNMRFRMLLPNKMLRNTLLLYLGFEEQNLQQLFARSLRRSFLPRACYHQM